jgi:hypothetical protein
VVEANSAAWARKSLAATTRQNAGRIFILERKTGPDRLLEKLLKVNDPLASHVTDTVEICSAWKDLMVIFRRLAGRSTGLPPIMTSQPPTPWLRRE